MIKHRQLDPQKIKNWISPKNCKETTKKQRKNHILSLLKRKSTTKERKANEREKNAQKYKNQCGVKALDFVSLIGKKGELRCFCLIEVRVLLCGRILLFFS
jgi:aconitase A